MADNSNEFGYFGDYCEFHEMYHDVNFGCDHHTEEAMVFLEGFTRIETAISWFGNLIRGVDATIKKNKIKSNIQKNHRGPNFHYNLRNQKTVERGPNFHYSLRNKDL